MQVKGGQLLQRFGPEAAEERLLAASQVPEEAVDIILGDDTITGRRLMEMIQPEACMDKPEAVDCAQSTASGLSIQAKGCIISMSLRPVMVS